MGESNAKRLFCGQQSASKWQQLAILLCLLSTGAFVSFPAIRFGMQPERGVLLVGGHRGLSCSTFRQTCAEHGIRKRVRRRAVLFMLHRAEHTSRPLDRFPCLHWRLSFCYLSPCWLLFSQYCWPGFGRNITTTKRTLLSRTTLLQR